MRIELLDFPVYNSKRQVPAQQDSISQPLAVLRHIQQLHSTAATVINPLKNNTNKPRTQAILKRQPDLNTMSVHQCMPQYIIQSGQGYIQWAASQ